ncbi:MAG: folate-binding protein YgfZ [Rhodobacteraceae bacterium]|nr:folate-binding protein YgfZ [Paracoccaceae bacterium]
MLGELAPDRLVLCIGGTDREHFLHRLVTNDPKPQGEGLAYAALLTPQGKYLVDFFLLNRGKDILLDVKADLVHALTRRLMMYKLRADVTVNDSGLSVTRGLGDAPEGAWPDPRDPALGWRGYGLESGAAKVDWDATRVARGIPETGIELIPEDSFILEMGFDRLSGVDHRKGCYVGQEVTSRMKHKTKLRKGLTVVEVAGTAPLGTDIMAGDRQAGTLFTQSGGMALAYLRFDRAKGAMSAGDAKVVWPGA